MPRKKVEQVPVAGSADVPLSLEILAKRLQQLESLQKLQALEIARLKGERDDLERLHKQAVEEREKAEEGLRAALEQLQKLRESAEITPIQREGMLAELSVRAAKRAEEVRRATMNLLRDAEMVEIENPTKSVWEIGLNGVIIVIPPGKCRIPRPFLDVWNDHLEAIKEAQLRDEIIRDRVVPFGLMEEWRKTT